MMTTTVEDIRKALSPEAVRRRQEEHRAAREQKRESSERLQSSGINEAIARAEERFAAEYDEYQSLSEFLTRLSKRGVPKPDDFVYELRVREARVSLAAKKLEELRAVKQSMSAQHQHQHICQRRRTRGIR
ncbi:hypothetical protein BW12_03505 [Bifidobacterium sp. UTCIF-3]|uniref:hypothetical protein n=1 Tax=Bifidobacterium TaxID=1678 RepID=UPI0005C6FBC3|nr:MULTISPECIES: hypothetical protein [Bifidobacterium]TPF80635.1 hypothetical protein BW08_02850 [Bifidobacterium sp. UTCIF-24]TPF82540.1 hypothetical protein BW12_03505 [Bifidobacterium sp. UTCIF-3]TPF84681.1 hypothetical protein BW07_02785 [Bifidobacterium sp. UTCIF-36]